uniref:Uncharacterized protein n=1 Tax=Sus scrofa TaxID=9823 RepID=A0A8D0SMW4_PIG
HSHSNVSRVCDLHHSCHMSSLIDEASPVFEGMLQIVFRAEKSRNAAGANHQELRVTMKALRAHMNSQDSRWIPEGEEKEKNTTDQKKMAKTLLLEVLVTKIRQKKQEFNLKTSRKVIQKLAHHFVDDPGGLHSSLLSLYAHCS